MLHVSVCRENMEGAKLHETDYVMIDAIEGFIKENGYSPTIREIMDMTGYSSTATVHHKIHKLAAMDILNIVSSKPRAIKVHPRSFRGRGRNWGGR